MDFKEAIRIWKRMCKEHRECKGCPAEYECVRPTGFAGSDESKIEATITKWAEEHPERTIADDFLEKHPKAPKDEDGIPFACAQRCGYTEGCIGNTSRKYCAECWRRPLAEVET